MHVCRIDGAFLQISTFLEELLAIVYALEGPLIHSSYYDLLIKRSLIQSHIATESFENVEICQKKTAFLKTLPI